LPPASPFLPVSNGVQVSIRLIPNARRNLVEGAVERADGAGALRVRVTAVPEKGNANAALLDLLATVWDVPKSHLSIKTGATSRNKIVLIKGDPDRLLAHLGAAWKEMRSNEQDAHH